MKPPKWIALTDKEPKEGQAVVTWHEETGIDIMEYHTNSTEKKPVAALNGKKFMLAESDFGYSIFSCCRGFLTDDVTHWMPISNEMQKTLIKLGYV